MLTITDLSASKELDHKALTEVRGGGDVYSVNNQSSWTEANAGLVAVAESNNALLSENNAIDITKKDFTTVIVGSFNRHGYGYYGY